MAKLVFCSVVRISERVKVDFVSGDRIVVGTAHDLQGVAVN